MAPRKKRPVLYEVFRPHSEGDVAKQPVTTIPPRQISRPKSEDEIRPQTTTPVATVAKRKTETPLPDMTVTISRTTLAVLVAAVVALLLISFVAGRRYEAVHPSEYQPVDVAGLTGSETEEPEGTDSRAKPETSDPAIHGQENPPAEERHAEVQEAPAQPRAQVTLQRGHTYIVVQHFNKNRNRSDAEAAAAYLLANGVECAMLEGPDIRLVATQGFLIERNNTAATREQQRLANQLQERIKQLGQQYNRQLARQGKRGYSFSDCYPHLIK